MSTYSFLNINCFILGPGIAANVGAGAAVDEEGISLAPNADKNKMDIGADGIGQHSLIADDAGKLTIRLLKTSPQNGVLQAAYDLQTSSSALHGQNVITLTDSVRGDFHVSQSCAFAKKPEIVYGKEGKMIEWTFDSLQVNSVLGISL